MSWTTAGCKQCGKAVRTWDSTWDRNNAYCNKACRLLFQEKRARRKKGGVNPIEKRKEKKEENFYEGKFWRAVRYEAIKKYGKVCVVCESEKGPFHVDHIKPRSKYPELEYEITNLQIMCVDCNKGKSNTDDIDWRKK